MRIAVGTDETTPVTRALCDHLRTRGHEVALVSADEPWPDVGRAVATRVAAGAADLGVVC
ncbi:MAG: galactose isomerase, partial [Actinomyces sp.]